LGVVSAERVWERAAEAFALAAAAAAAEVVLAFPGKACAATSVNSAVSATLPEIAPFHRLVPWIETVQVPEGASVPVQVVAVQGDYCLALA
jgi:hypothetical protein